ncbi:glycosyltransferase family 4 protein [Providencia alcalifaciens]|uniref:glycosyltransferase family 4 protein n=1 Tax=Providencia alcalifaciens TaxID=126385 RepID=UPI002273F5A5|nr:glycosyltransferase family 4 protein [Providencia rettgeri]MCY0803019.1 glycosyltransferase family 4 protein [Providencia rettgeri]
MKRIILQIGNFGGGTQLDGQTIKTTCFYHLLIETETISKIKKIDIHNYRLHNYIFLFISLAFIVPFTSNIFIGLGNKGMKVLAPYLIFLCRIYRKRISYYVIGGWLFDFLDENKELIKKFKRFQYILVELPSMVTNGKNIGLDNLVHFPNFREAPTQPLHNIRNSNKERLKLVFFSRVIKEKGIFNAIDAVNDLILSGYDITLDIYGPCFIPDIENIILAYPNINYHGKLRPEEINNIISLYDTMLFPTFYSGEGYPGAIIDAFMSHVPVIASDWKYNSEIITHNSDGLLFNLNLKDSLKNCILTLYNDNELLSRMKVNAYKSSFLFSKSIAKETYSNLY